MIEVILCSDDILTECFNMYIGYRPVLVSSQHLKDEGEESNEEQSLMLMKWGLVPSWHKGDPSAIGYKMNNCRSEGMMEKASFKRPFEKGQRCVVLADGYDYYRS